LPVKALTTFVIGDLKYKIGPIKPMGLSGKDDPSGKDLFF